MVVLVVCTAEGRVGGRTEDINREAMKEITCQRDAEKVTHKEHRWIRRRRKRKRESVRINETMRGRTLKAYKFIQLERLIQTFNF